MTTQSNIQALKVALMTEYKVATRGKSDSEILHLAEQYGLVTEQQVKAHTHAELEQAVNHTQEQLAERQEQMAQTAPTNQQAQLLAQLLATMQPQTPQLNEQRIIELINEHSPVRRIEVSNVETGTVKQVNKATHECFERALQHLQIGNQLYFYGRSGAGKSTTAQLLADALDTECYIQGAILAKFEALGSLTATGYNKSIIRKWLENENGGLLCIDEIDASCPRALVTLMSIFDDNGELTFPDGETFKRTNKHLLIVTANTTGAGASASYVGRTRLDKATLNRFVQIEHDYSETIENTLADDYTVKYVRKFREFVTARGFDGALITPRTIKQAGKVAASKLSDSDKQSMIYDILRQGLTQSEFDSALTECGAY